MTVREGIRERSLLDLAVEKQQQKWVKAIDICIWKDPRIDRTALRKKNILRAHNMKEERKMIRD